LSVDATSMKFQIDQCKAAIDRTSKGLGEMCSYMSSINSKQGKIRDRGDEMAKSTIEYATTDLSTMQVGLDSFGRSIANVQEYRNAYLHSIDASVITPIYAFDRECKDARAELNKLEKDQRKYEKTLKNPNSPDSAIIRNRVLQSTENMKQSILKFEEKRLSDTKKHLMEYCRLEMTFAAKCLEQFSQCYQELAKVAPEEDLIEFEKVVSPQRLMSSLGYNNQQRGQREQNLVTQLQNTSLSQPKSLTQQSQQFQSSFASNLRSTSNVSYGTPVQSTARSHHSAASMQSETPVTATIQMPSARSSNGNVDDEESEEGETETESEDDDDVPPARTTRTSAWAQ